MPPPLQPSLRSWSHSVARRFEGTTEPAFPVFWKLLPAPFWVSWLFRVWYIQCLCQPFPKCFFIFYSLDKLLPPCMVLRLKGNMHAAQNGMGFSTPEPELQDVRGSSSKMKISQYRIPDFKMWILQSWTQSESLQSCEQQRSKMWTGTL